MSVQNTFIHREGVRHRSWSLLSADSVSGWVNLHHRLQEDDPLLLPETQVTRKPFLSGGSVPGAVSLAGYWNGSGELWFCASVQVSAAVSSHPISRTGHQ